MDLIFYVIRHGRTDWNANYKLQGRTDIPLNEEGRQMAREAAEGCRQMNFDLCFTSPLKRARETAEILLEGTGIPIVEDDRLKEMSFGIWEGTERLFDHPELPIYKLFKDPDHYEVSEGAESFEELFARTGEFVREKVLPLVRQGKKVLVVGHGAMNCSIIAQAENIPIARFWETGIPNCGLKEVVWKSTES